MVSAGSSDSEVLIASGITIGPDRKELCIKTRSGMQTTGDWSELIAEMSGLRSGGSSKTLVLLDGTELSIEGYLLTDDGEKLDLDHIGRVGYGDKTYLSLSSSFLEWERRNYKFHQIVLRSNATVTLGRMVWISYDPASTHTGVKMPRIFR